MPGWVKSTDGIVTVCLKAKALRCAVVDQAYREPMKELIQAHLRLGADKTRYLLLSVHTTLLPVRDPPCFAYAPRLQQGLFEGACSDLRSSLAAGSSSSDEARALLLEAEAGAAMVSCPDPEAKGRGAEYRRSSTRRALDVFR